MIKDEKYWNEFYKNKNSISNESSFAKFVRRSLYSDSNILELGCGDGRDCVYFLREGLTVVGLDASKTAIDKLKTLNLDNSRFECCDFTTYKSELLFENVYSRFTLHSLSNEDVVKTLKTAYELLDFNSRFFIECRSDKNKSLNYEFGKGHFRNLINLQWLMCEAQKVGFKVLHLVEDDGLATYKGEDPIVIRLVLLR